MTSRLAGLTGATLPTAPTVCHRCIWWQSRSGRTVDKDRWIAKAEDDWGAWGTVYYDDDGRLLGSMQYGPSELFPRAAELPAGPPSPDAVLVTCAYLVAELPRCYAVLGNHDFADSRDPFSKPAALDELEPATLLRDDSRIVELRGLRVQIAGVDPSTYRAGQALPERLADRDTDFRILLCHYPNVIDKLTPGAFHLVLAGHLHSGQIALPYGAGKLRLSQVRWTYVEGLYQRPAATLHVSPGLGTTFVPFRFFARPEATELVLHSL